MLMRFVFSCILIVCLLSALTYGQSSLSYTSDDAAYRQGVEFVNNGKYLAAIKAFEDYQRVGQDDLKLADAQYYIAFSAVQLRNADGEKLIEEFIRDNPAHTKASLAYYELASLKYNEKNYKEAIKYFEKLYFSGLNKELQADAKFKYGYACFTQKQFDKAYEMFDELKREENKYQFPASYYAGYLNFEKGEYDRAFYDFTRAEKSETYGPVIPSMLVKVYYKQKRYSELVEYADTALKRPDIKDKQEIYLYLGEAYFNTGDFNLAAKNYNLYLADKKENTDRALLFRIGYVQMETGDNAKAIESFKNVALISDTLGYVSSYYLGNLYIKQDNKNYALAAYKTAKDNVPDKVLQEDSQFQYAKLNLDLGYFDEAINAISDYQRKYPDSHRTENIDEILTIAYLNAKNYDVALRHIESMKTRSATINKAYQQIAFFKGTELFNDGKFPEAIVMFDKSLTQPHSNAFVIKAHYWKGEAYSIDSRYAEASNSYAAVFRADAQGVTAEYAEARYGIGYAYFNQKDYAKALDHFKYYTEKMSKNPGPKYLDAMVRLGDCYFATKQYERALSAFDATIAQNTNVADYCHFRKGVIYGILGNLDKANQSFDMTLNKYPQSRHIPAALFQKAQFNFENGSYSYAMEVYTKLINEFPESTFIPFALQSRAIAASNLERYPVAEADYKRILEQYPTSEVANNALLGLQEVLNKTGNSDDFSQYVDAFRSSNPNSTELENVEWVAAKSQYFNQQYAQSVASFDRFISAYPSSSYITEAIYLKADALQRTGDVSRALESYYAIAEDVSFNRHVRVVQRIAELELVQKNYPNAIVYFEKLEKISATKKDQATAWSGLMNAYFQSSDYAKAIEYGKITIEKGQITPTAKNEALLIISKSYLTTGDNSQAREFLEQAAGSAKDVYSAEAFYLIAKYLHDNNLYKESLDRLFQFSEYYASYDLWLGKAFILMADNYIGLKEDFQAKATLESVVANSPVAEVVDEAKMKLMVLNEKAKQQAVSGLDTLELENDGNE